MYCECLAEVLRSQRGTEPCDQEIFLELRTENYSSVRFCRLGRLFLVMLPTV